MQILFYQILISILSDVDKKELWEFRNHKGANDYPEEINKHVQKETAILGPF